MAVGDSRHLIIDLERTGDDLRAQQPACARHQDHVSSVAGSATLVRQQLAFLERLLADMAVDFQEFGTPIHQGQNIVPAKVPFASQALVNRANEFQILWGVDSPSLPTVVRLTGYRNYLELRGILVDIRSDVAALIGPVSQAPCPLQRRERNGLGVKASRVSSLQGIASVIWPTLEKD